MISEINDNIYYIESDYSFRRVFERQEKIFQKQEKIGNRVFILFHSIWDMHCKILVEAIEREYSKKSKIYLVDSWRDPKLFTSEDDLLDKITVCPTLVTLVDDVVKIEDHLPTIYRILDVG